jgi:hypothetical protein
VASRDSTFFAMEKVSAYKEDFLDGELEPCNPDALRQWLHYFGCDSQRSFLSLNWCQGRPSQGDRTTRLSSSSQLPEFSGLHEDYLTLRDAQNASWAEQKCA